MKLIIGLGNPGEKYKGTRHNLGFRVVEELAEKFTKIDKSQASLIYNLQFSKEDKFKSEIAKGEDLIFVKPQTNMNASGIAVAKIAKYFKIPTADIIVIHDELDLPLGKIKVRVGGSAAGHHGVESIINSLGNDKFARVRLGIGTVHALRGDHDRQHSDTEHFVLEEFTSSEKAKVKHMIKQAVEALEIILDKGVEVAQNQFN